MFEKLQQFYKQPQHTPHVSPGKNSAERLSQRTHISNTSAYLCNTHRSLFVKTMYVHSRHPNEKQRLLLEDN